MPRSNVSFRSVCISFSFFKFDSQPSMQPSRQPTSQPTRVPTSQPSMQPTRQPSSQPSRQPLNRPTAQPSRYGFICYLVFLYIHL